MDQAEVKKALDALESWRNQLEMYRLVIPELRQLFTLIVEGSAEAARLEKRKGQLQGEIEALTQEHQRHTQRLEPLRREVAELEGRLTAARQGFEEFKAKFRPAAV